MAFVLNLRWVTTVLFVFALLPAKCQQPDFTNEQTIGTIIRGLHIRKIIGDYEFNDSLRVSVVDLQANEQKYLFYKNTVAKIDKNTPCSYDRLKDRCLRLDFSKSNYKEIPFLWYGKCHGTIELMYENGAYVVENAFISICYVY